MKCRLTKECEIHEPDATEEFVKLCVRRGKLLFAPIGTEIDHPDCHYLVLQCAAEAADDECRQATEPTAEQLVPMTAWHADGDAFREVSIPRREWSALRLSRGIHWDDFKRYEAGEILGYTPDGEYVPGPNWKPEAKEEADEDDE